MPDAGQRFVEGALQTGGGISRALLKKYLMDYEQKKAEEEAAMKKEALNINKMLSGAQTDYYKAQAEAEREPEVLPIKDQILQHIFSKDPDMAAKMAFPQAFKDQPEKYFGSGASTGIYEKTPTGVNTLLEPSSGLTQKQKADIYLGATETVHPFGISPGQGADTSRVNPIYRNLLDIIGANSAEPGNVKSESEPPLEDLADSLKQAKAAGNEILWDNIVEKYPGIDIEDLKRRVGE